MSRLTKLFKKKAPDDSASEADEGLVSDTAENDSQRDSNVSEGHSANDWADWSVHDESDSNPESERPLNDGTVGSEEELRKMKSESDLGALKASVKRKKKKKKKTKETEEISLSDKSKTSKPGEGDSAASPSKTKKKKKKRAKSEPIQAIDTASLVSGDTSVAESNSSSLLSGDSTPLAKDKKKKVKTPHSDKKKSRKSKTGESTTLPSTPELGAEEDEGETKSQDKKSKRRSRSRSRGPIKNKAKSSKKSARKSASEHVRTTFSIEDMDAELAGTDAQSQEILRLHQMLSDALQKVATQSAEQIEDKDQFLKVSTELSSLRSDYEALIRERDDLRDRLVEREETAENSMRRIDNLEKAIERQLDEQDQVEAKLLQSEDEVDKLLIEIQDLERAVENAGGGVTFDETIRSELKETKKTLVDKEREIDGHKSRIAELEEELGQSATVTKLQIDEIEEEKKVLEGKLKGERLELQAKLTLRDDEVARLEKELSRYRGNSEYEEIAVVRDDLEKAKVELAKSSGEVDEAQRMMNKAKTQKEDLLERNNNLNEKVKVLQKSVNELTDKSNELGEKVLSWTEQTYHWKARAEAAEKKAEALAAEGSDLSDTGSAADENPQGLFLQAIMDKQETTRKNNRWSLFGGATSEEDPNPDEIRVRTLEELNQKHENTIAELRSEKREQWQGFFRNYASF